MNDTRDTLVNNLKAARYPEDNENGEDIAPADRPTPRFKDGDRVIAASRLDLDLVASDAQWDYEFSGWLIFPGAIGIHECNFILAKERDQWEPHFNGLWSWWTRKEAVAA
jgi:hypothetical protein